MTDQVDQDPVVDTTVYARVVDGVIVEYPVFGVHITNRAQPFSWYTKVLFDPTPDVPEFYHLKETLVLTPDVTAGVWIVRATYSLEGDTLADLLSTLRVPSTDPTNLSGYTDTPVGIETIAQNKIERISYLATFMAQDKMDTFAQTRNYTDIGSAISYFNSAVPKFQQEAVYCNGLRDATWTAFYAYLAQVLSAQVPVPTQVSDIEAVLPAMAWPA